MVDEDQTTVADARVPAIEAGGTAVAWAATGSGWATAACSDCEAALVPCSDCARSVCAGSAGCKLDGDCAHGVCAVAVADRTEEIGNGSEKK